MKAELLADPSPSVTNGNGLFAVRFVGEGLEAAYCAASRPCARRSTGRSSTTTVPGRSRSSSR